MAESVLRIRILAITAGAQSGLAKVSSGIVNLGKAGGVIKAKLLGPLQGLGPAILTGGVVKGLADMKSAASDLNESVSKSEVVFGSSAKSIQAWAATGATAFGQSKQQALEAAGTFGNLFKAMKLATPEAAKMSTKMVELAGDLASFNNANPEEVLLALRSGLVGETEPLRKFGVNINAARIEAEAFSLGLVAPTKNLGKIRVAQIAVTAAAQKLQEAIKKHGANSIEAQQAEAGLIRSNQALKKSMAGEKVELNAAQKAQAAYSIILKDTKLAQGDFARTADGAANKERSMAAETENLKAKLGQGLLPIYSKLLSAGSFVVTHFQTVGPVIATVAAGVLAYRAAMLVATVATQGFGASLNIAAGPIALAAAALAGLFFLAQRFGTSTDVISARAQAGTAAYREFAAATRDAKQALADLHGAELGLKDARLSRKEAGLGVREAEAALARAKREGASKAELRRLELQLERARMSLALATARVNDAEKARADAEKRRADARKKQIQDLHTQITTLLAPAIQATAVNVGGLSTGLTIFSQQRVPIAQEQVNQLAAAFSAAKLKADLLNRELRKLPRELRTRVRLVLALENIPKALIPQVRKAELMALRGRAAGGAVAPGVPYIVGERGPEVRVFDRSGSIVPNHRLSRAMAQTGGRGDVYIDKLVVQVAGGMIDDSTADRIVRALRQLKRSRGTLGIA